MMLEKMLTDPIEYSSLFIDMNSFFASVEQQYNPQLRNKPMAVCTGLADNCTIIAASIEAKRFGIKTGTKVGEAKNLYPFVQLVCDSPVNYREVHHKIMKILNQTSCSVVPKSIDEAYLKIPSYLVSRSYVFGLAKAIKALIKKHVGEYLNCSIGIGPNIWIAKMAASSKKPDGLVLITTKCLKNFYEILSLIDFNGISFRLARKFYQLGIYNGLDLYEASFGKLRSHFGINGVKWYLRLRGYEVDDLPLKPQKTIGHQSTIMPKPAKTTEELKAIITKMSYKIGYRLRKKSLQARRLIISTHFIDGDYWSAEHKGVKYFNSNFEISSICISNIDKIRQFKPVKKIHITTLDLREDIQLPYNFFEDLSKYKNMSMAVDRINSRFGNGSIVPASSLHKDFFPDKVGFGNT